jgi:UDP-glucose 4-epimerase
MRILVTGGAGFIGSTLVDACLAQGHDVAVVDDLSAGTATNIAGAARFYEVDVRTRAFDEVLASERPEIISHHAAQVSVRRSVDEPVLDADINVLGTLNVLEAARRHGVRRVIFASTGGAIYGEPDGPRADETHPRRPQSPYAIAKLAAEHYLEGYRRGGLEAVVLRYANVYGPRQDPHGEAGVVAIFIQRILAGLTPTIFGDGEQVRDFVYVDDVVRANLLAHDVALGGGAQATVFNVGTGQGTSVNALWAALAAIARPTVSPSHEPARTGDLVRSVLDATRARTTLGWEPRVDLATGLGRTWDWFVARAGKDRVAA